MDPTIELPSAAEVAALSGADLDHALVAVERARRNVEATYLAVLDRAEETKRFEADGHAGVRGWAAALTEHRLGRAAPAASIDAFTARPARRGHSARRR